MIGCNIQRKWIVLMIWYLTTKVLTLFMLLQHNDEKGDYYLNAKLLLIIRNT